MGQLGKLRRIGNPPARGITNIIYGPIANRPQVAQPAPQYKLLPASAQGFV